MARPPIDPDELHTERVGFRLTAKQLGKLQKIAGRHGWTVSQLARAKTLGIRIVSRVNSKAVAEQNRLGGLLKHLVAEHPGTFDSDTRRQVGNLLKLLGETTLKVMAESGNEDSGD